MSNKWRIRAAVVILAFTCLLQYLLYGGVYISEFLADNSSGLRDEDGKREDWIELHNSGTEAVSLEGWWLTDKAKNKKMWEFPAVTIAADGYLLVWASGKDRRDPESELHTSFSLSKGGEYLGLYAPDPASGEPVVADEYAPEFPQQLADVSYGRSGGVTGYFADPTPGAVNGSAVAGPLLLSAWPEDPDVVRPVGGAGSAPLSVSVKVIATAKPIVAVKALYRCMWGAEVEVALLDNGVAPDLVAGDGVYSGSLPTTALAAGEMLRWRFEAHDSGSEITKLPAFEDPLDSPEYFGTVAEVPATATSLLPVLEWFVEGAPNKGPTSSSNYRTACYFNSNFYDNVQCSLHGQSTTGFSKKSYNMDFTKEKRFLWREGERRVKDINLLTNYADKTKTRNTLSHWVGEQVGTPHHFAFPVRVQLNGYFHGVMDMVEDSDDRMLRRNGLNEDGALYKIYESNILTNVKKKNRKEEDNSDLSAMVAALATSKTLAERQVYAYDNIDIAAAVSYFVARLINSDRDHGHKNYLLYRDTGVTDEWQPIMWDVDLSHGHVYSGDKGGYFYDALITDVFPYSTGNVFYNVINNSPEMKRMITRRLRTIMDTLVQPPGTVDGILESKMREIVALIDPDPAHPSAWTDGDMDYLRWGIHNNFIKNYPRQEVERVVSDYFGPRREYLFGQGGGRPYYNGEHIPDTPQVSMPGMIEFEALDMAAAGSEEYLILRNNSSVAVDISGWRVEGDINHTFKPGTVIPAGRGDAASYYVGLLHLVKDARAFRARSSGPRGGERRFIQSGYSGGINPVGGRLDLYDDAGGHVAVLNYEGTPLPAKPALKLSELMYHPALFAGGAVDEGDEFIELCNVGSEVIELAGLRFTDGVTFDFSDSRVATLAPGGYLLVVKDLATFRARYPEVSDDLIAGEFSAESPNLSNSGEKLVLRDGYGRKVISFTYSDSWQISTDGAGHSLVPDLSVRQDDDDLDYGGFWGASVLIGGSPGRAEPVLPLSPLVINEVLAHTDYPAAAYDSNDAIELYNRSGNAVTLGAGWYLSDSAKNLAKWQIPPGTVIGGYGWRWFDEVNDFHADPEAGFGLNKAGEDVFLSWLPGDGSDRVVDAVRIGGEENGVSLIRYPDGAPWWDSGVPTPGAANQLVAQEVRIDEIMYHPVSTDGSGGDNTRDEFVELYNPSGESVALEDQVDGCGSWRLTGGVEYSFPAGTRLGAGERLVVVSFDPAGESEKLAGFLASYNLVEGAIRMYGPYSGKLGNRSDSVRVVRPLAPDKAGDEVSWHVVDRLSYYDREPWYPAADGRGSSLTRRRERLPGDNPGAWVATGMPTPGMEPARGYLAQPVSGSAVVVPAQVECEVVLDGNFIEGEVERVAVVVDGIESTLVEGPAYRGTVALGAGGGVRYMRVSVQDAGGSYSGVAQPLYTYNSVPEFSVNRDLIINLNNQNSASLSSSVVAGGEFEEELSFGWSLADSGSNVALMDRGDGSAELAFREAGEYEVVFTMQYGHYVTNHTVVVSVVQDNTLNPVPYAEDFERYEPGTSLLGVNGWYGYMGASAEVVPNSLRRGAGGSPSMQPQQQSLAVNEGVMNMLSNTEGVTNVCVDLVVGFLSQTTELLPIRDEDIQASVAVTTDGRVALWHGVPGESNRWTVVPQFTLDFGSYARVTIEVEYVESDPAASGFKVWVDRQQVTEPQSRFHLASTSNNRQLSSVVLMGQIELDEMAVNDYNTMLYRRFTARAGEHGVVKPDGSFYVPVGGTTNIAVIPDSFYRTAGVAIDGDAVQLHGEYSFSNVWQEHTLEAEFAAKLTQQGVPEIWLHGVNPNWVDNFEAHALADSDGDGVLNWEEFVAGTDPLDPESSFKLDIAVEDGVPVVTFLTLPFEGGAYDLPQYKRYYALEHADELGEGGYWKQLLEVDAVVGGGGFASHTNLVPGARGFYRGRVWLAE